MQERSDQQLLRAFVGNRSDEAFGELVKRHASLVYGTARRKLDSEAEAQEVTQAVFIALARKAAFLCHYSNLSGWLHKTSLLECQQHLRTELRRRRREETAMKLQEQNVCPNGLVVELDDALLELSDKDRQPLLLRFFESLSLREVGKALSIHEDAAQKRVAKSLQLLAAILKRRGDDVGPVALATILAGAAQSAPAYLVISATQCATAASSGTALALLAGKFMALTKTQSAAVCALALAVPLILQTQILRAAHASTRQLEDALSQSNAEFADRLERLQLNEMTLGRLRADRQAASAAADFGGRVAGRKQVSENLYHWSDSADFVRLPKSLLREVRLTSSPPSVSPELAARYGLPAVGKISPVPALDADGNVSPALAEALNLDEEQKQTLTESLAHFKAQFKATVNLKTTFTNVMPPLVSFMPEDGKIYTMLRHPFPEEGAELKRQIQAEFENAVGAERASILFEQGREAFNKAFQDFGENEQWFAAGLGPYGMVNTAGMARKDGKLINSFVRTVPVDQIPEELRHNFQQSTKKSDE
jgi:RNA polymerase sigma factor (sigma-70 family)